MEGARYSRHIRLPELIDDENEVPSRNYMVKLLIEAGGNPNIQSPEVLMTPLHWLAFHGDHRAVTKIMDMNKMAYIETHSQCCGISFQT
jgi:ankyrin repeat protein